MYSHKGKPRPRVLIADDDPVIRHWLTSILEGEGYGVVSMNDGRDAFRVLQGDADFAGAVFDLAMPYLEGPDLIRFMRTERRLKRIPVMMITAETDIKLVANGFAAGATVLLPKPFTRRQLQQRLRMMLGTQAVSKQTSLLTSTRKVLTGAQESRVTLPVEATAERENQETALAAESPVDLSVLISLESDDGGMDSDLAVELIDLYLENGTRQVNEIKAAAAKMDEESLKQTAHALKGSSLTMGAGGVAKLCEQLEWQSSAGVSELAQKLESAFASTVEIFKTERQKRLVPVAA